MDRERRRSAGATRARSIFVVLAVIVFVAVCTAPNASADVYSIDGISLPGLARALEKEPVQLRGSPSPTLTASELASLRQLINQRDKGRIYIAVVTPMSLDSVGELADTVGNDIPRDGIVLGVAGYNFDVASTWGNPVAVLNRSIGSSTDLPLYDVLREAILGFVAADIKAHHPMPYAKQLAAEAAAKKSAKNAQQRAAALAKRNAAAAKKAAAAAASGGSGTLTSGSSTSTTPAVPKGPSAPTIFHHKSQTVHIVFGAILFIGILMTFLGLRGKTFKSRSARRRDKERSADTHQQVQADFVKLGEHISDLDIDSSMPNASPEGKAAYARAIDCYSDAEKRLKQEGDSYQFEQATQAVRNGLKHISAADRLFSAQGKARDTLAPQVIEQLTKLAALHDRGALTDDEFASEKQKLLA